MKGATHRMSRDMKKERDLLFKVFDKINEMGCLPLRLRILWHSVMVVWRRFLLWRSRSCRAANSLCVVDSEHIGVVLVRERVAPLLFGGIQWRVSGIEQPSLQHISQGSSTEGSLCNRTVIRNIDLITIFSSKFFLLTVFLYRYETSSFPCTHTFFLTIPLISFTALLVALGEGVSCRDLLQSHCRCESKQYR